MNKIQAIVLGALILILVGSHNTVTQTITTTKGAPIQKVEIYSLSWDVLIERMSARTLIEFSNSHGMSTVVRDHGYLLSMDNILKSNLQPVKQPKRYPMNARTVFLLERLDQPTDTIVFFGFEYFQFNQQSFVLDSVLLEHVLLMLPHEQVKTIRMLEPIWKEEGNNKE